MKQILSKELFAERDIYKYFHDLSRSLNNNELISIQKSNRHTDHGFLQLSNSQLKYIICNNFKDVFEISDEDDNSLILRCISSRTYDKTFKNGITFGYITNDIDHPNIIRSISALENFDLNYEVLVIGNHKTSRKNGKVRYFEYASKEKRFLLNKKKSLIIKNASKENVCIMHDHILLDDEFLRNLINYGNDFHFYDPLRFSEIKNAEIYSSRNSFHKSFSSFGIYESIKQQPYINDSSFINGSFILGKRKLFDKCRWPDHLAWGELEDVHFSRMIFLNGYYISLDKNNRVLSNGARIKEVNRLQTIKNILRSLLWKK
tara:strand:+ start:2979 stop:3932 length:954 start_codon:yes stop_codon:yes gene_type:complete